MHPTKDELRSWFEYDSGNLFRIRSTKMRPDTLGKPFGGLTGGGYVQGWFKGKLYYLHHLVYLYHFGTLPEVIDHKDGDKLDNKVENLRGATPMLNTHNRVGNVGAASPFKGVSKKRGKWRARITVNKVTYSLSSFDTEEQARDAYNEKAKVLHGDFYKD